jgi:hypothetical protein
MMLKEFSAPLRRAQAIGKEASDEVSVALHDRLS